MDLGGDSNRLYFYDPLSFLKYTSIYAVFTLGKGLFEPNYYYLPYVGLLAFLKLFIPSSLIISLFNGIKLSIGFISIYLIVRELLAEAFGKTKQKIIYFSALLAGIFYVASLGSFYMAYFWYRAITSHNQVFLNPLIFYLLLKFFLSQKSKYLWTAILTSFIFSPNFGLTSAPPFFAFYPLAFLFLFLYVKLFGKKPIFWKRVGMGILLFLGVQAFHLLGQIINLLDNGSWLNQKVFSKLEIEAGGVQYFTAIHGLGKAVLSLLLPSEKKLWQWASFITPLIIIFGFILNKTKKSRYLLISLFFVITLFLATANITNLGFEFYRKLFYIPGLSMFRNFNTQWLYVFIFFYALLFGFAAYNILVKLKSSYTKIFSGLVFLLLVITGLPLFAGEPLTKSIIRGSNNVPVKFKMDPRYEETLRFISTLPDDGKILVLPLTDFYYQVITGRDGGAYEGPSTISHLTGKYSFVGYQEFGYQAFDPAPYAEDIMRYSREKNYQRLLRIFTTLNIRYLLHNSDPKNYEESFSPGPYGYMMTSLPKTQEAYKDFISQFPVHIIYSNGPYTIYELDKSTYNPTIFIPDGIYESDSLSFDNDKTHSVFINKAICDRGELRDNCEALPNLPKAQLEFKMINPTKYLIVVRDYKPGKPLFLVMQHTFHKRWKLILNNQIIGEQTHIPVNGYANGWILTGNDLPQQESFTLNIKFEPQKYFWYGLSITSASLVILIVLLVLSFRNDYGKNS